MVMDVHSRYRTDAFNEINPLFTEWMMLTLGSSDAAIFVDDELNLLWLSKEKNSIFIENDEENVNPLI